ncbi:putative OPA3-like protein-like [Capsicum annuum]|nr:putative OPA3-like protein-like [Capsicum annuum]
MGKGLKSGASHQLFKDKAKNRVDDLQGVFNNLQSARKESRTYDAGVLEEQGGSRISSDLYRLLLGEEEDDATSALAAPKPDPDAQKHDDDAAQKHDVAGFQEETKWVGTKARDVDGYKLWYSGSERRRNGVDIFVDEKLRGAYAPQVGLDEEEKRRFWEVLEEVIRGVPSPEKILIGGDFNGHIRSLPMGWARRGGVGRVVLELGGVTTSARALEIGAKLVEMGAWEARGDMDSMWERAVGCIKETARGPGCLEGQDWQHRGDWWWNEEVKKKVETKKAAYVKLAEITAAKSAAFERLYLGLEERGREKRLFRLAKSRERKGRDLGQVKCIKGEDGIVLGELEHTEELHDFGYCRRSKVEEVYKAISKMRRGRATGPDEILLDFLKFASGAGLRWLTHLFNNIFKSAKMSEAWRWSTMISVYKNKGDIQSCNNYRGIKLLSHTTKIWERVVERRLR